MFPYRIFVGILALYLAATPDAILSSHVDKNGKNLAHDRASFPLLRGQAIKTKELDDTVPQWHNLTILPKGRGWSYSQPQYIWMIGKRGSFVFHVPKYKSRNCRLRVKGVGFAVKGHKTVNATMQLGSEKPKKIRMRYPKDTYAVTLGFSGSKYEGRDIEVLINVDSVNSPANLGISGDPRMLGISIAEIRLLGC